MKTLLTAFFLASAALAQDPAAVARATQACGPIYTQFEVKVDKANHPASAIDPGKALVYIIEDQKTRFFKDVTTRLGADGIWMGANRGNSYFFFLVAPGEHHLCADWQSTFLLDGRLISLANLRAEAGKVYYFRVRTMGSNEFSTETPPQDQKPSLDLELVNVDQGQLLVASAPFSTTRLKR